MVELLSFLKDLIFFAGYVHSSSSFPEPLSEEDEAAAIAAMLKGDEEAKQRLITHNLRLVAHVAKKFATSQIDNEDLISIGSIGLIKAISTFDPDKGAALATYAARCIQNEILMSIRAGKKLLNEVSMSASVGKDKEGNEISLVDIMGTPAGLVLDEVELRVETERLNEVMKDCLSERERLVVQLRYGLSHGACLPQREVGKLLNISRSYVSRIEKKALQKLNKALK